MKRLLLILILTFSFQTLAKADDIGDFEIEGMSIGDSLQIYLDNKKIKMNSELDLRIAFRCLLIMVVYNKRICAIAYTHIFYFEQI